MADHKKKHHRLYFVFFCVTCHHIIGHYWSSGHRVTRSSSVGGIRERTISAAHIAILVVVVAARVTHQRKSTRHTRVAREVGTVIKSSITRNTHTVFVLIKFCHALFMRKLDSGYMGLRRRRRRRRRRLHSRCTRAGGISSSSPIHSSTSIHRSSFGCL